MLPDRRQAERGGRRLTDKIACPKCGCLQSSVVAGFRPTREMQQSGGFWRRRSCAGCGVPFTTQEKCAS